jgi:signal transduction histidine kinase
MSASSAARADMEILALYSSPDTLQSALCAGARQLAEVVDGFALIYPSSSNRHEPAGWAGLRSARDATAAGKALEEFRARALKSERPLRSEAPSAPAGLWERAGGGVFGFPLALGGRICGVVIVGCPGAWPRRRSAEFESTLRQIALVLDHHAMSSERGGGSGSASSDPSDDLLQLSEQLLAQDIELIKRGEQIQHVERVKQDLVEKLSTELRAPLERISELMVSALAGEHENLSESGRDSLRLALDETQGLTRLLQNILDVWRLRQKLDRVELRDVNLEEVIQEACFSVAERVGEGVRLEKRFRSLPRVRTDLAKLNTIVFHLLDNAVKFTRRGQIELEMSVEDGQLLCAVSDTGIGIAADDRPHVFDEFFQVDPESARGAGLGLTIAKGLIDQLGGAISFTSEIGQGSRFSFTLPVVLSH